MTYPGGEQVLDCKLPLRLLHWLCPGNGVESAAFLTNACQIKLWELLIYVQIGEIIYRILTGSHPPHMVLIIWNYDHIQGQEETDQMNIFFGDILMFISYLIFEIF